MIIAFLILLPVAVIAAWLFLRPCPHEEYSMSIRRFNWIAMTVAVALSAGWILRTYLFMAHTVDSGWWPIISGLGALLICPLVLAGAAAIRVHIFRRKNEENPPL